MKKRTIIAIVGMPGAGKSEASAFFRGKGMEALRFGSVIIDGLQELQLPLTASNEAMYREKIRKELGMAAIAIKMLPKIDAALSQTAHVVLDGLYSWEEYVVLQEKFPEIQLVCIYARPEIRYDRLAKRQERPFTHDEARARDIHEITIINKGGPIAIADFLIKNETTKEAFVQNLEATYQQII